jgi:hypothetical protein
MGSASKIEPKAIPNRSTNETQGVSCAQAQRPSPGWISFRAIAGCQGADEQSDSFHSTTALTVPAAAILGKKGAKTGENDWDVGKSPVDQQN